MSLADKLQDKLEVFISEPTADNLTALTTELNTYHQKTKDLPWTLIKPSTADKEFFIIAGSLEDYQLVMITNKPYETIWKLIDKKTNKFIGMWLYLKLVPDESVYGNYYNTEWAIDEMCPGSCQLMTTEELKLYDHRLSMVDSKLVKKVNFSASVAV